MHSKIKDILHSSQTPYTEIRHDSFHTPIRSPFDFAQALGTEVDQITKTVFLRAKTKEKYIMAICSSNQKLDLPKLALLAQVKKLEFADQQELADQIGYPTLGVTAIGIPAHIEVYMDKNLLTFPSILTGAGEVAVELKMNPNDLASLAQAKIGEITIALS